MGQQDCGHWYKFCTVTASRKVRVAAWLILTGAIPVTALGQPEDPTARGDRPNILLIVADDLGYTDIGAFGGEIDTPNLDRLAAEGLRLSNFHVLPTCAPTRAVLLTGVDNHRAGIGAQAITAEQEGEPGYEGHLNSRVATLPEVLRAVGYRTYHTGKWHLGHEENHGPHARGFDETFTLLAGGASHYADAAPLRPGSAAVYRRNGKLVESLPHDFYSSRHYTDLLLEWMERDKNNERPFFAYLAYTAPHDPLHAPPAYIEKYRGRYDRGWEVLRQERFDRLQESGLIPAHHQLPPWPSVVKRWDSLSGLEQANKARDMEVYAAMVDFMDEQIGRVYRWLEANGELDNTLIVFLSDNGANGFPSRLYPGHDDEYHARFDNSLENRGASGSFIVMGAGWATASTAAYRLLKGFSTEGGIRTPAIVRLPGGSSGGEIHDAFVHVRDLMPTFLELANAQHPAREDSELATLAGNSLMPLFEGRVGSMYENEGIGYELHGTRAYIKAGWKALQMPLPLGSGKWELYNLATDPAETKNLADKEPDKLAELVAEHMAYEKDQGVIYSLPSVLNRFVQAQQLLFVLMWTTLACFVYALVRGYRKSAIASVVVSMSSLLLILYTKSGQLLALMF